MIDFKNYLTLQDFKIVEESERNYENNINEDNENTQNIINDHFYKPLAKFLQALKDNNQLSVIKYGEGHYSNQQEIWNDFILDKKNMDVMQVCNLFYKLPIYFTLSNNQKSTEEEILEKYNKLTNLMNKGDISHTNLSEDFKCMECAQSLKLAFNDWKPWFGIRDNKIPRNINYGLTVPHSCLTKKPIELDIIFPTGQLLISDCFHIDVLNNAMKYMGKDAYSDEKGINTSKGRIFNTTYCLDKCNVISVVMGNSNPSIFKNENKLLIGSINNENENIDTKDFEEVGKVNTDLWATTIIDRQDLFDLLYPEMGNNSNEFIEKYINDPLNDVSKVNVNPGKYKLRFHGNYYDFNNNINDKTIPKDIKVLLTVFKDELVLENKMKLK